MRKYLLLHLLRTWLSAEAGSAQAVGLGPQFLTRCWPQAALHSLPYGCPCMEAPNMAACITKTGLRKRVGGEREEVRARQQGGSQSS